MGRVKFLAVVALVGLMMVAGIMVWTQPGLDNYRRLLERGEYALVRTELGRQVARRPDWHEARMMLVELELADAEPLAALEHILYLLEHEDGKEEVLALRQWLGDNGDTETYRVLIQYLTDFQDSMPRELALELALDSGDYALVLESSQQLHEVAEASPLLSKVWTTWNYRGHDLAWQLALVLGQEYQDIVLRRVGNVADPGLLVEIVEELLELTPTDNQSSLALLKARALGGAEGLAVLLALEGENFSPNRAMEYGDVKFGLLAEVNPESLTPELLRFLEPTTLPTDISLDAALRIVLALEATGWHPANAESYTELKTTLFIRELGNSPDLVDSARLNWVRPWVLLDLARSWLEGWSNGGDDQLLQVAAAQVLAHLEEDPLWTRQVNYLRQGLSPLASIPPDAVVDLPDIQFDDFSWHISPDSRHILAHDASSWRVLPGQTIPSEGEIIMVKWSPWGQFAVWEEFPHYCLLTIYSRDTLEVVAQCEGVWGQFLGWQDAENLVFSSGGAGDWVALKYNISHESWESTPGQKQPHLTPAGTLAWVSIQGGDIEVELGEKNFSYSLGEGEYTVYDWLPNDQGVVIERTDLAQPEWVVLGDNVSIINVWGFVPFAGGWNDSTTVYGAYPAGQTKHVLTYDLLEDGLEKTGIKYIRGQFDGGSLVAQAGGRLNIYRIIGK